MQDKLESFWDPAGARNNTDSVENISNRNTKLKEQFNKIKNNPGIIKKNILLLSLVGVFIFILLEFLFVSVIDKTGDTSNSDVLILPFIFASMPIFVYLYHVKELQKDLLNLSVADRFNWLYDPEKDSQKWKDLKDKYPEIFGFGNEDQYIDNQFWGLFDDTKRNFWLGRFNYTVSSGKTSQKYQNLVYGYRLTRPVTADFSLIPQSNFTKVLSSLTTKEISTESSEFNKLFYINYKGDRGLVGADVLQVLDPDTIVKLIDYNKSNQKISMVFHENVVLISTKGDIRTKYTKIKSGTFLDERDATLILEQIHSTINIAEEVLSSIDGFNKKI